MFGTRTRVPKPVLMLVVFGIFLVIVGVTAVSQAILVSVHFSSASLEAVVGSDAATVRTFVNGFVTPSDLSGEASDEDIASVEAGLAAIAHRAEIVRVEIIDPTGRILASDERSIRGQVAPVSAGLLKAQTEQTVDAAIVADGAPTEAAGAPLAPPRLLRAYFPLIGSDGETQAVVAIWRDAAPLFVRLDEVRRDVVIVIVSAALIVSVFLYLIFRSAQRRIIRQTLQLVDSTRRDPLTGLLNHGALVAELALAVEDARLNSAAIGVVLIDLDNFRALNDGYGHDQGDTVLLQLAANLQTTLPERALCGRYGPDEFLVISPAAQVAELEPMVDDIRARLVDQSLDVASSERMPISISAGIAAYPDHGASVTELLSTVAIALAEAKASGGDSVRVAGRAVEATNEMQAFDTLQGLIFAVDTKDRYTKRHSEDVARYGVFLARQLGLDPSFGEVVRRSGLLHDVGKIGIPDHVLRKPGPLTGEEYEIVKQHVALGDSIVRNIEQAEAVRAGIRHHHERWDGNGYLHALAGEDIPLVARILAVGDAFSAMTTTRPYRKALPLAEALRRLGDAAGTQLDERLVIAFIAGMESASDAPLPGEVTTMPLWVPGAQVA